MDSFTATVDSMTRLRDAVAQFKQRIEARVRRDEADLSAHEPATDDLQREDVRRAPLEQLRRQQAELARRLDALEEQSNRDVWDLLDHISGLETRVRSVARNSQTTSRAVAESRATMARQAETQRALEALATTQSVTNIVNTLESTAYGERGSLLSKHNLILAGNQLLWNYADPIARWAGLTSGPSPSALAQWAPVLSLLTARVLLGDRQHVRFLSGVATFETAERVRFVSLRSQIADGLWTEFQARTDVAATAQPLAPFRDVFVTVGVSQGLLRLEATPRDGRAPTGLRVAWLVDTGEDIG